MSYFRVIYCHLYLYSLEKNNRVSLWKSHLKKYIVQETVVNDLCHTLKISKCLGIIYLLSLNIC